MCPDGVLTLRFDSDLFDAIEHASLFLRTCEWGNSREQTLDPYSASLRTKNGQRRASFEEHCRAASLCGTAKVEANPAIPRIEASNNSITLLSHRLRSHWNVWSEKLWPRRRNDPIFTKVVTLRQ